MHRDRLVGAAAPGRPHGAPSATGATHGRPGPRVRSGPAVVRGGSGSRLLGEDRVEAAGVVHPAFRAVRVTVAVRRASVLDAARRSFQVAGSTIRWPSRTGEGGHVGRGP
ncbi:hypothetical protein GCM10023238_33070 [Streptomyces heliomycini]